MSRAALDTRKVLEHLYPGEAKARRRRIALRRMARRIQRRLPQIGLIAGTILVWVIAHVYYYNLLVNLDSNTAAAWSQVQAQLNRRYNIQQNIALLVMEYAKHEREMQLRVTELRTDATAQRVQPPAVPPLLQRPLEQMSSEELNRVFPQIKLFAEQYPQLRASENFQQFSRAIIETETMITNHIMAYNGQVNRITTALRQVPGNIFGPICGFRLSKYHFYQPERHTLDFRPVAYEGRK